MSETKADSFLRMIRRSQRGRLKVYLGYAAGVGKTYEMLLEGHRLMNEGIDVAVGLMEAHGRAETARLAEGLEVIPRRRQEYRGIVLEEMDLDAILARKPQIVLIDELAHTNVPGSRNPKRYQDVQDILAQGIHVITTLNIQHLESLYDIVERATGVRVHERLPDAVLAEADQIVNVDVTSEDLSDRLKEGKIYPQERVGTALTNFFRKTNLEQLRELTLRELASQIDLKARDELELDRTVSPDQVMVCLSSRGPNSDKLLRYASRLAGRLNRNWYAVYVQTPAEAPTVIDAQTQRMLADTLTLAKQLGAIVFTFKGEDIVDTILQFAHEYRVGHIIIGSPAPPSLRQRILGRGTLVDRLIREVRDMTVVVLDTRRSAMASVNQLEREDMVLGKKSVSVSAPEQELSTLLTPGNIVIWNEPVRKDDLLRVLAHVSHCGNDSEQGAQCLAEVLEREAQGTTFLNEGVAFPHARIAGMEQSCMAFGLTHRGIADVKTEKPIEGVFLIFSPREKPEEQVRILGLASRAAQDRRLMEELRTVGTTEEAYAAIRAWEEGKKSSYPPPPLNLQGG